MNWESLTAFIVAEDPAFASRLRGVPPEDLDRVEQELGVRLPMDYRQFAAIMGRETAGFYLFGPGENQNFADLVADLPTDSYPADRYFKIAFPSDDSDISPPDYFLDLSRSDDVDGPVVMFEDIGEFTAEEVAETGFTFAEQLTRRIFTFLVLERLPERATMTLGRLSREQAAADRSDAIVLLGRMGFAPVLDDLPRVSCLRRDRLAALVDERVDGFGLAVRLGSPDKHALEVVLDQLLERFPDAIVNRPGGPLAS
jgi:hypothetical protein